MRRTRKGPRHRVRGVRILGSYGASVVARRISTGRIYYFPAIPLPRFEPKKHSDLTDVVGTPGWNPVHHIQVSQVLYHRNLPCPSGNYYEYDDAGGGGGVD